MKKLGMIVGKNMALPAIIILALTGLAGCNKAEPAAIEVSPTAAASAASNTPAATATIAPTEETASAAPTETATEAPTPTKKPAGTSSNESATDKAVAAAINALPEITDPDSITVLVNKNFILPPDFVPEDLVYPDVPFIFKEKTDKRKMRSVAARALEKLVAGAEKDDVHLAGASAYRSAATQRTLFKRYVNEDGFEKARTYSALPGTSEHETGLAIDVSGVDGKCAAQDCFAGTKEAIWIAEHAAEYGFIVRYPKGKDSITGYKYEPWHIRYVGIDVALEISGSDSTLENYLNAVPVSQ